MEILDNFRQKKNNPSTQKNKWKKIGKCEKMQESFTKVKQKLACQTIAKTFFNNYVILGRENSVYLTYLNVSTSYNITLHRTLLEKLEKAEINRKLEKLLEKCQQLERTDVEDWS